MPHDPVTSPYLDRALSLNILLMGPGCPEGKDAVNTLRASLSLSRITELCKQNTEIVLKVLNNLS